MKAMDPQVGFRFRLLHPDGRQEVMVVDAERALIGSAAHCEVRLPRELAAPEHIEVYANERIIQFASRVRDPGGFPLLNGARVSEGQWAPGSVLAVGNVRLMVELVDMAIPRARAPVWALFALIPLVVLTVGALAYARGPKTADAPIPEAPALLPDKASAVCPHVANEQRPALAMEKERIALAKRERSPFAKEDGIEAVSYFESAAACYRASGQPREAVQAEQNAAALRVKLEEEYRLRRVRLEHAYKLHDPVAVKRELAILIPMTAHRRGPYTEWLASLNRAATAELDQKGKLWP
jgi:hypothetical protein